MQKIELIDTGADIEVFIKNRMNNKIVSAEPYIMGNKYDPFRFDPENKHFSTSLDNVLAEFTIPPAKNVIDFINYVERGLNYINVTLPVSFEAHPAPCEELHPFELQSDTARTFGCEPDYSPYVGLNKKPRCSNKNLRSAGFHIHIAYNNPNDYSDIFYEKVMDPVRNRIVEAMDLFLGVPSVLIEPDNKRKELYGQAGAYRPKSYGLEYRVLSSYFCKDAELIAWAYTNTEEAIDWLNENTIDEQFRDLIQSTINTNDKEAARKIIIENRIPIPINYLLTK